MTTSRTEERTTVLATFSSRRDAEVAGDYLADTDIRTFVSSDDAGGMHPQMQRPHGVKLVVMEEEAQEARKRLEEADLLPAGDDNAGMPMADSSEAVDGLASTVYGVVLLLGAAAVVLVLLMYVLG